MLPKCTASDAFRQRLSTYLALPGAESRVALWDLDESGPQPVDLHGVHMLAWAAGELFALKPDYVLDIGGDKTFVAILSQYTIIDTVDIRPWPHGLGDRLLVRAGSILALPSEDESEDCVTCLSVLEHIGLGRYGDPLDPQGSRKACAELSRVLAPGGHLLLSVPVSHTSGVAYCAHRIFTREQVLAMLSGFRVASETCLYPDFGSPERVSTLGEWGYCMWCVHLVKEE